MKKFNSQLINCAIFNVFVQPDYNKSMKSINKGNKFSKVIIFGVVYKQIWLAEIVGWIYLEHSYAKTSLMFTASPASPTSMMINMKNFYISPNNNNIKNFFQLKLFNT